MPRVLERPAVDSTWAVSSSDICFRLSQRYVISQPQSKCQRCARCCQSCGTVPHIPQESQLIPHHGAHQKKVYALARMVRQSLTGMWWAGAGQSGAEQNRRLPVQLAEIRLAAQDGSDAVKLALVLFGKGTARVPGCDILLVAACPGVCGDPGLPSSSTVPLEGMGNGLQYHAPAAPFLLFSACWDGVALV